MKNYISFLFVAFFFLSGSIYSQIEKLIVESYYISDQFDSTDTDGGAKLETGSVTYRVFVDLKPGSRVLRLYGDTNHLIRFSSTRPFFNNIDGETYAKDLKKVTYKYNTVAVDTWLTLGQTAKTLTGKTNFGVLKTQDNDGSFIGGTNNDGGTMAIPGGLLKNNVAAMGLPLPTSDGMDTMMTVPTDWADYGIKDFLSGADTTMFGHIKVKSEFKSYNFFLKNSGVRGILADSNQVLIAQLTTKGDLTFELNLEVEQTVDSITSIVKYVANDSILLPGEKKNSYLKYPFPPPVCGCKDPDFLEYDPKLECAENSQYCVNRIVFGCMDNMACNFNPKANYSLPSLCCYPGSCGGRDITLVCPSIKGSSFDCEIYPNPAQNSIFMNVSNGAAQEISYSVFNYFGVQLLSESLGVKMYVLNHEIDLSTIDKGLYLIRINSGGSFINKQFFKN